MPGSGHRLQTRHMTIRTAFSPLLGLGLLLAVPAAAAATPTAFTATYDVSQGGEPMGVATVTLRAAGNGEWVYMRQPSRFHCASDQVKSSATSTAPL